MKKILLVMTLVFLAGCRDDGDSSNPSGHAAAVSPAPTPGPGPVPPAPDPIPLPQMPLVASAKSKQALPGKLVEIDVAGGKPPYRIEADIGFVTAPVSNPIGVQAFYQAPQVRGKDVNLVVTDADGMTKKIYLRIPKRGDIDSDFGEPKFKLPNFFAEHSFSQAIAIFPLKSGGYLIPAYVSPGLVEDIIALVRLDGHGKLDETYGESGVVKLRYQDVSTSLLKTFLLPNDQVMIFATVGKISSRKIVATRLNVDGKVDTEFGTNGWQDVTDEADRRWDKVWYDEASRTYRLVTSSQGFDGYDKPQPPRVMVARTMSVSGQVISGKPYNLIDDTESTYNGMAQDGQEFAVYLLKKVCHAQRPLGLCKEQVIVEKLSNLMDKVASKEIVKSEADNVIDKTKYPSLLNVGDELWAILPKGHFDNDTPMSVDIYKLDKSGSVAPTKRASFDTNQRPFRYSGHDTIHSIKKLADGSFILNFGEGNRFGFGSIIVQANLSDDGNSLKQDLEFANQGMLSTNDIELVNDSLLDKDGGLILAGRNGYGFDVIRIWE